VKILLKIVVKEQDRVSTFIIIFWGFFLASVFPLFYLHQNFYAKALEANQFAQNGAMEA
jgi:hypothetical protein